jgi:hypothetical protein
MLSPSAKEQHRRDMVHAPLPLIPTDMYWVSEAGLSQSIKSMHALIELEMLVSSLHYGKGVTLWRW